MKLGEVLFRYRSFFPVPYVIVLIYLFEPTKILVFLGGLLILFGCFLRIFIQRFTGDWTRGSRIGGEMVIMEGPFSVVRHPLYFANFIIGSGYTIFSGYNLKYLFPIYLVLFGTYYFFIIKAEEGFLSTKFPDTYINYRRDVPAFIPLKVKWVRGKPREWSYGVKKELSTILTTIVILLAFAGRWLWMR